MYGPGDVRVEDRLKPTIVEPTDAIIRVTATCICGSDLWPYRGDRRHRRAHPDGPRVRRRRRGGRRGRCATSRPGDFVVGSFFASDNTCEICRAGYQTHCVQRRARRRLGRPGRVPARPARRRHPGRHARHARRRPGPVAAGRLRRARHRLVRRRRRRGRPRQDRRRRRGRRGRAARRPGRQAAGRRADHRDEPPRRPAGARPRVRRHRHRQRTRRRGRGPRSRSSPTGSARTPSSRPSAPRSR